MKKIGLGIVALLSVGFTSLFGQQKAQFSQFMVNPFLVNPALSGAEDFIDVKLGYRQQWVGFGEGENSTAAPKTMYLSGHMPIGKPHLAQTHPGDLHNWHGAGVLLYRDNLGLFNANVDLGEDAAEPRSLVSTYAALNYSYNIGITDGSGYGYKHKDGIRLSLGTFVGINQFNLTSDRFYYPDQALGASQTLDPLNLNGGLTASVFDVSFGGLLYLDELFHVGLSTFQTLGSEIQLNDESASNLSRHYYLHGGYKIEFQEMWYLMPSFLWKSIGGVNSVDLNARVDYNDLIFGGVSFRVGNGAQFNNSAITLMAGALIELKEGIHDFRYGKHRYGIEIFYSYDISTLGSQFNSFQSGTHEITLGFRLPPMYRERNAEDTWKRDAKRAKKKS